MIFIVFLSYFQNIAASTFQNFSTFDLLSKIVLVFGFMAYLNVHFEESLAIIKLANYYPEYLVDYGALRLYLMGTTLFILDVFALISFNVSLMY